VDDFSKKFCMSYIDKIIEEHLNQQVAAHEVYKALFPPTEEMKACVTLNPSSDPNP